MKWSLAGTHEYSWRLLKIKAPLKIQMSLGRNYQARGGGGGGPGWWRGRGRGVSLVLYCDLILYIWAGEKNKQMRQQLWCHRLVGGAPRFFSFHDLLEIVWKSEQKTQTKKKNQMWSAWPSTAGRRTLKIVLFTSPHSSSSSSPPAPLFFQHVKLRGNSNKIFCSCQIKDVSGRSCRKNVSLPKKIKYYRQPIRIQHILPLCCFTWRFSLKEWKRENLVWMKEEEGKEDFCHERKEKK